MQALPNPICCPSDCSEPIVENIPGPAGSAGAAGSNGTNGSNAFTSLTSGFTQPAVNANVTVSVAASAWASIGQEAFVEGGGYYLIVSKPSATSLQIQNRGYDANVPPGTGVPNSAHVSPAGEKGEPGVIDTAGALLAANDLSDVLSASTSRTNLGATTIGANLFTMANPSAIRFLRINANNTPSMLDATAMRTALGLALGVDVQAFDTELAALAGLASAADRLPYFNGAGTAALAVFTALARTLLAGASADVMRSVLGKVLPRYGLLGTVSAMNLNSAGSDNAVTIEAARYRVDRVTFDNPSTNLTTATAGVFSGAGGAGTVIAADQSLAALTAASKFKDLTLDAGMGTDALTPATLYVRNGTAQGGAATANVFIFGWSLG